MKKVSNTKTDSITGLLEQYKLYAESVERVADRRGHLNTFNASLLSAILVLLSLLEKGALSEIANFVYPAAGFLGIVFCFIWSRNLESYKSLNAAKFRVIHKMEEQLPYPCFTEELKFLNEGKDFSGYRIISDTDKYVPMVLGIPYFVLMIYGLLRVFGALAF